MGRALADEAPILAGKLLDEFGSLGGAVNASEERLRATVGGDAAAIILAARAVLLESLAPAPRQGPILPSMSKVVDYLRLRLADLPVEQVHALYLDARHRLIREEMVSKGSLTSAACQPRDVLGRALELGATEVLLAHNHPSGDPQPSAADIAVTRRIAEGGEALGVTLLDHLIVARGGTVSLRSLGHIKGRS